MNEKRLSNGFMNGVTSRFIANLCLDQDNKVAGASSTHKKLKTHFQIIYYTLITLFIHNYV